MRPVRSLSALIPLLLAAVAACDRNIEPFVPGEKPAKPDLAKIFPPGAEQPQRSAQEIGDAPPDPPEQGRRGAPPLAPGAGASDASPPVRGTISLAPELEGRVPADAVLFLIARRAGSGPPLAVKRIPQPRFPLEFEIGPQDRMIETLPFVGPLQLSARVDGDGNATTRNPGDLQGTLGDDVEPGASGVVLVIDQLL